MHQQGQGLNHSNLVLMDRKPLSALAHHANVTETLVGVRLEILSEGDHCDWEHRKRTGREELNPLKMFEYLNNDLASHPMTHPHITLFVCNDEVYCSCMLMTRSIRVQVNH